MIKEASFIMREVGVYLGASNPFLYSPIPLLGTLCRKITVSSRREWRLGSPLVTRYPCCQKDILLLSFPKPFPQKKEVLGESAGDPDFFMSGS